MVWDKVRFLIFIILVGTATGRPSDDEERRSDQGTQVKKATEIRQPRERPAAFDEVLPKHNFPGALAARDRTARMDLVKSIDDILQSPYDGPLLTSLEPLLIRNSISRLTRDSNNFRREPSPPLPSGNDPFSVPFSSRPARPFSSSFSESNVVNSQPSTSFGRPFDESNAARPQSTSSFRRPFDGSNRVSSSPTTSFRRPFEESGTQIRTSERLRRRPQPSKSSHFEPSDPASFHESFRPVEPVFESRHPPSISQPSNSFTRFVENPPGGLQSSFSRRPEGNSGTFSNDFFNRHTRRQRRATTNHEESFLAGQSTHEKSDRRSFSDSSPVYGKELSITAAFEPKTDDTSFRMDPLNSKSPLAREESQGFIVGKPSSFPDFQSLGGFGPMDPIGTKASNFVPAFNAPSVAIPDIGDEQPELNPENFPSYQTQHGHDKKTPDNNDFHQQRPDIESKEFYEHYEQDDRSHIENQYPVNKNQHDGKETFKHSQFNLNLKSNKDTATPEPISEFFLPLTKPNKENTETHYDPIPSDEMSTIFDESIVESHYLPEGKHIVEVDPIYNDDKSSPIFPIDQHQQSYIDNLPNNHGHQQNVGDKRFQSHVTEFHPQNEASLVTENEKRYIVSSDDIHSNTLLQPARDPQSDRFQGNQNTEKAYTNQPDTIAEYESNFYTPKEQFDATESYPNEEENNVNLELPFLSGNLIENVYNEAPTQQPTPVVYGSNTGIVIKPQPAIYNIGSQNQQPEYNPQPHNFDLNPYNEDFSIAKENSPADVQYEYGWTPIPNTINDIPNYDHRNDIDQQIFPLNQNNFGTTVFPGNLRTVNDEAHHLSYDAEGFSYPEQLEYQHDDQVKPGTPVHYSADILSKPFYYHGKPYQYLINEAPEESERNGLLKPLVNLVKKLLP